MALKEGSEAGTAIKELGCTISEFIQYIESKWLPDMTWDNYGLHGWHIDHIKPMAHFDLTSPDQIKLACHYTNMRPLWAKDNLNRGGRTRRKQKNTMA